MKTTYMQFSFLTLLLILFLPSCSIEKRIYNNGYYIDWHTSVKSAKNQELTAQDLATENYNNEVDQQITEMNSSADGSLKDVSEELEKIVETPEKNSASTDYSGFTLKQIMQMPGSVIKSEIKNEFHKLKTLDVKAPVAPKKMSAIIKIAIILTGLAVISLIIAFWSWYFYLIKGIVAGGAPGVSTYKIFLVSGLISLALGLTLFILYWITH